MRLIAGQIAPVFLATDIAGLPVDLNRYRGHTLLLSFYRYASCPFCNLRVHQLSRLTPQLEKAGVSLVAVFQSSREGIMKYVGKQQPPFPIIPDPEHRLYRQYGVETSWRGLLSAFVFRLGEALRAMRLGFLPGAMDGDKSLLPADFLIGPDGRIRIAYYGRDIGDHLPIETLLRQIDKEASETLPLRTG